MKTFKEFSNKEYDEYLKEEVDMSSVIEAYEIIKIKYTKIAQFTSEKFDMSSTLTSLERSYNMALQGGKQQQGYIDTFNSLYTKFIRETDILEQNFVSLNKLVRELERNFSKLSGMKNDIYKKQQTVNKMKYNY